MADAGGDDGWEVVAKKPKAKPKPKLKPEAAEGAGTASAKGPPPRQQQQKQQPPPARKKAVAQPQQPQQQPATDAAVEDTAVRIGGLSVAGAAEDDGGAAAEGPASTSTPTPPGAEEEGATAAQSSEASAPEPVPAPAPVPAPKKQFSSWAAVAKDNVPAPPRAPAPAPASAAPTMNGGGEAAAHTAATTPAATVATPASASGAAPERRPTVEEVVDLLAGTRAPTAAPSLPRRQRGLVNTGNACFRNVILQALLACTPFHALLRRLRPLVLLRPPQHLAAPADPQREAELCGLIPTWLSLARLATALEDPGLVASDAPPPPVVLNGKGAGKKHQQQQQKQQQKQQQQKLHGGGGGPGFVQPLTPDDYLGECFAAFRSSEAGEQQDPHDFSSFLLNRLHEEAAAAMRARAGWALLAGGEERGQGQGQQEAAEEAAADDGWQEVGKKGTVARLRVSGVEQGGVGGGAGGGGAGGGGLGRFETSAVTRIFYGRQRSDLRRSTASKNVSATVQPSESLQLEVSGTTGTTLEEALAGAFAEETIAAAPGSRSSGLKKRMLLDALPPVLVLQLKRFAFDPQRLQPIKICRPVEYPPTLAIPGAYLSPALRATTAHGGDPRYALFAAVLHHGRTVTGGHYTAYCRGSREAVAGASGGWCVYDDERVEEASEAQARRNAEQAYLFFYARVGGAAAGK